tara:strand:+ start:5920 stop:7137 length:1218 start_codon:yes stop_codon:yes gene_type:complete
MNIQWTDIQNADQLIQSLLSPTPLVQSRWLSEELKKQVYLKLETLQPIGSFKLRGATYRISTLSEKERKQGVIAASAGNHSQGVAWGAKIMGVDAQIVMPESAPLVKIQNTQNLGAKVHLYGSNYDEAYEYAKTIAEKENRIFIHAFDDPGVIAGQATTGMEIFRQLPEVDTVICSIGGGGLAGGMALAFEHLKPSVKLVGCQAEGAPSMLRSFQEGKAIELPEVKTFADGISVKKAAPSMYEVLKDRIHKIYTASDSEIADSTLELAERARIVAEGSGALPLSILKKNIDQIPGENIVLVISGGNIDVPLFSRIIQQGLLRSRRRIQMSVIVKDQPGALHQLTKIIFDHGANVLQVIHDRNDLNTTINETRLELTLETRNADHSDQVIRAISQEVESVKMRESR